MANELEQFEIKPDPDGDLAKLHNLKEKDTVYFDKAEKECRVGDEMACMGMDELATQNYLKMEKPNDSSVV